MNSPLSINRYKSETIMSAYRRFPEEILAMIGKRISVKNIDGEEYEGDLSGIDENLNIIVDNLSINNNNAFKIIMNGKFIKEIRLIEKPFDLKKLANNLDKVFPGLIKLREDIGVIIVMERFKVTEKGIIEGSGITAERIKKVYDETISAETK